MFLDDYDTMDGTGVRDYIHVDDLARGNIKVLEKLEQDCGLVTYNLGIGRGYSVIEMIDIFSEVSNRYIQYKIVDRRPGHVAECYADVTK